MDKKMKKLTAVLVTLAILIGCMASPNVASTEAAAKKLKVTVPTKTVAVNTTITLKTNVKAKFKSSNKKIATVSSKGVVKGKKAGKVTITVTSKSNKNQKKTVKLTVKNRLVITAPDNAEAALQIGETTKIKTNLSSTYASSAENIAEVSSSGIVTAKSAGTATITVTSKKYKKLKKEVNIIVTKPEEATTEATTTRQPTSDDSVKPGDKPTTETPTAEQPSSTATTTEAPTTEAPTTEEKTLVGIDARYRGDKVPKGSEILEQGLIITEKYSDDSSSEINNFDSTNMPDISEKYTTTIEDDKEYHIYTVKYAGKTAQLKVEVVDVGDTLYPISFMAQYQGEAIPEGEIPKIEDIYTDVVWSDYTGSEDIDTSKLEITFWDYTETHKIEYYVTYHYTFTDNDGNKLYVCVTRIMAVPYE